MDGARGLLSRLRCRGFGANIDLPNIWEIDLVRGVQLLLIAASLFALSASMAEARSCTDFLNACMTMYDVDHGRAGRSGAVNTCRLDYEGCLTTGVWAGQTATYKGLEKK